MCDIQSKAGGWSLWCWGWGGQLTACLSQSAAGDSPLPSVALGAQFSREFSRVDEQGELTRVQGMAEQISQTPLALESLAACH